ncbi:MAG: hypothetical protein JNM39_02970 [Bdellovibrionaceae bacterium]|nr:hypothetical protein [Pseudobdellovibrionaceae bacterium]
MKSNKILPLVCLIFVSEILSGILASSALGAEDIPIEMKGNCFFNSTKTQKNIYLSYTIPVSLLGSPLGHGTLIVDGETYLVDDVDVRTPERPTGLARSHQESSLEKDLNRFNTLWPTRINSHVVRVFLGDIVRDVDDKKVKVGSFELEDRQEIPVPPGTVPLSDMKNWDNLTAAQMAFLNDEIPGCALTQLNNSP